MSSRRHMSAIRSSQPGGGAMKPPSPWTGSTITQATFCGPTWTLISSST
jgi:hypothetical protein